MMEIINSIFFHPVPAWVLWMLLASMWITARMISAWYRDMARLAEDVLNQFARDRVSPDPAPYFQCED